MSFLARVRLSRVAAGPQPAELAGGARGARSSLRATPAPPAGERAALPGVGPQDYRCWRCGLVLEGDLRPSPTPRRVRCGCGAVGVIPKLER